VLDATSHGTRSVSTCPTRTSSRSSSSRDRDVGIDVERMRVLPDLEDRRRFFSAAERAASAGCLEAGGSMRSSVSGR
jgi:hypothetical protein